MTLSNVEEILEDYRNGKMVIIIDDEDRENEGDLMMAADHVTADDINFMARYGRGLICITLTEERCTQIGIPLMVGDENGARFSTNFTMSIEAAEGVTTGISAGDRARTIQAAVAKDAKPSDIVMPGHIFPIMAQPSGVLSRAGHTEAGVDFARLAGRDPSSVICEILNEDGTMARLPDLLEFAKEHDLKVGTIADLISYRLEKEPTVLLLKETILDSPKGKYRAMTFEDKDLNCTHLALVYGEVDPEVPIAVRIHVESDFATILKDLYDKPQFPIHEALKKVTELGSGIVVILCYAQSVEQVENMIAMAAGQAGKKNNNQMHLRLLGSGSQILSNIGAGKIRVLGKERVMHGLSGFNLEVVDFISE